MGYDWEGEASKSGQAPQMPAGEHPKVCVSKIIYSRNNGEPFTSRSGDPQMMLVFVNPSNQECGVMFTLSEAAGWTLARLLSAMGHDLGELKRRGIEPQDFQNLETAKEWLTGHVFSGQSRTSAATTGRITRTSCRCGRTRRIRARSRSRRRNTSRM